MSYSKEETTLLPVSAPKKDINPNPEETSLNKKYMPNIVTNNGKQYIYKIGKPKTMAKQFILFGILTVLLCVFGL